MPDALRPGQGTKEGAVDLRVMELVIEAEQAAAAARSRQCPPSWKVAGVTSRSRWHFVPFVGATDR